MRIFGLELADVEAVDTRGEVGGECRGGDERGVGCGGGGGDEADF